MTSELSVFAERLRDLFPLWLEHGADDSEFNAYAMLLFALQFKHNAAYRKFCESRKVTPNILTCWQDIPAMPTSAFKELDLTCLPSGERTTVFHSSGTTEQRPSRHFHNAESLGVYEASLWSWFQQNLRSTKFRLRQGYGGQDDLRVVALTPPPTQAPHSSLIHMFETVRQKAGAPESVFFGSMGNDGAWVLDCESVTSVLSVACQEGRRLLLLGTAFSFVHLLDWLGEHNMSFKLPAGSRVMETGGYKGRSRTMPKAELHALITKRLGVPVSEIVCEYGMSELSSQAYDGVVQQSGLPHPGPLPTERGNCRQTADETGVSGQIGGQTLLSPLPEGEGQGEGVEDCRSQGTTAFTPSIGNRYFRFPPWAKIKIISPETGREVAEGETGLIHIFDLANVFSVMAVQTEDLGVRHKDGFELVGRAAQAELRGCSLMSMNS